MKYAIPALLIILFSCNSGGNTIQENPDAPVQDPAQVLQTADGKAINLIGSYEVTDTANEFILFPLQVNNAKDKEESVFGYSKRSGEGNLYWNIIFHNYKTGENHLLEPEKKILIGGYSFTDYYEVTYSAGVVEKHDQTPYIFYTVYTDDYNADKKLGTDDPAYFYISKPDGTGFKQVSPPNISITQKKFPKNSQVLLLSGISDSNKDKKFNADDEQVYYKVNMADPAFKIEEIFNTAFKIKLKNLFDKNWKK